jgi:hypothetical protein
VLLNRGSVYLLGDGLQVAVFGGIKWRLKIARPIRQRLKGSPGDFGSPGEYWCPFLSLKFRLPFQGAGVALCFDT